jgi:hypothetical protein
VSPQRIVPRSVAPAGGKTQNLHEPGGGEYKLIERSDKNSRALPPPVVPSLPFFFVFALNMAQLIRAAWWAIRDRMTWASALRYMVAVEEVGPCLGGKVHVQTGLACPAGRCG